MLTPLILEGKNEEVKVIGKIDTGADISCINLHTYLNKLQLSSIHKVKGRLHFLNNTCERNGLTVPIKIRNLNNITFIHQFEVVNIRKEMSTKVDVLLGVETLKRFRIGLKGVAHNYPLHQMNPLKK